MVENLTLESGAHDSNHRYLLCDSLLYGIFLKSRTWAYCLEPKLNPRAIDMLVMPAPRKDMIKALVQKYSNMSPTPGLSTSWRADFIENNGEGHIFLLHGGPGVGKTYTAECIAEYTNRPLLSLTCEDIGTDEVKMEQQLSKWFRMAEKWGLSYSASASSSEYTSNTDPECTVFLRCIEYYREILFLTTNRVGHFDDAFISRIHIIKYYQLSEDNRRQIWTQFVDKLTNERHDFISTGRAKRYILEDEIVKRLEWNGRENRNGKTS
ncbi:uncharacterized protein PODANS_5_10600 [Podospora anserina S mat+]|uniref:Podospora anserina S mat+ genomic DNA chromosome 5, supercontig 10 n=1 Tax=Podospora anserina (strain S / ATCC MYA-4624 / DSM 980 / FGSC 10383) TaxID=515849 RepID=B2APD0_PODAN|nr:uncharacterized protein PODANS_5_10600 [Podospora anserina S mat+]CAP65847.1 unnamed protein product [Podospora anserina S mat+]CDP30291.1 Putative protein of unknown function [Podospora anserina S mat+]